MLGNGFPCELIYIYTYIHIHVSHIIKLRIRDMLGNGVFDEGVFITLSLENYCVFPMDYESGLLSLKCLNCIFISF